MFELESSPTHTARALIPLSEIDHALTAQLVVAWAGETGEEKRLGWWRSDLVSEFGGKDLFRRLLPNTGEWAVLQGAREAARRKDAELRRQDHDPDRIVSLFCFGFELDERIDERLQDLKRSGRAPQEALPGLAGSIELVWNRDRFLDWVRGHGETETTATPIGRRVKGDLPTNLDELVRRLAGALAPLADNYPLPALQRGRRERTTARGDGGAHAPVEVRPRDRGRRAPTGLTPMARRRERATRVRRVLVRGQKPAAHRGVAREHAGALRRVPSRTRVPPSLVTHVAGYAPSDLPLAPPAGGSALSGLHRRRTS